MNDKWYLLFSGSSCDGMGQPSYAGRTIDKQQADAHYKKVTASSYSTGKVVIVTDDTYKTVRKLADI